LNRLKKPLAAAMPGVQKRRDVREDHE